MLTRILVIDSNCLDRLQSPGKRARLNSNLRATGRAFWPTGINILEALKSRNPDTRARLLQTLADLSKDKLAITLPGEALRRIAFGSDDGAVKIDWSEPSITRFFRHPNTVTTEEAAAARDQLVAQENRFNEVHARASEELRPRLKVEGGNRRWTSVAQFLDEFWSERKNLGPYIESLWASWNRSGPPPTESLIRHESWRLYFDAWGASIYARQVEHPQRGIVQFSDLAQLTYLGAAGSRLLASDDKDFRALANEILRGRYHRAEVVPLDTITE